MRIKDKIEEKVNSLNANGDSFSFLFSGKDWQNLESDDITLPVVYMDMPLRSQPFIAPSGAFSRRWNIVLMFLYRSELDDSPEELEAILEKAYAAQRQMHIRLNEDYLITDLVVQENFEVRNLFDTPLSGVVMPCNFTLKNYDSSCL